MWLKIKILGFTVFTAAGKNTIFLTIKTDTYSTITLDALILTGWSGAHHESMKGDQNIIVCVCVCIESINLSAQITLAAPIEHGMCDIATREGQRSNTWLSDEAIYVWVRGPSILQWPLVYGSIRTYRDLFRWITLIRTLVSIQGASYRTVGWVIDINIGTAAARVHAFSFNDKTLEIRYPKTFKAHIQNKYFTFRNGYKLWFVLIIYSKKSLNRAKRLILYIYLFILN